MKRTLLLMWVMATCIGSLAQTTQPKFNGDLDHFIYRNLLSTELVESKVTGAAEVEFFVETDGSLTDVKILKGDIPVLNTHALKLVKMMPKWIPGMVNGKVTRMKTSITVEYGTEKQIICQARALMKEGVFKIAGLSIVSGRGKGGKLDYFAANALMHYGYEQKNREFLSLAMVFFVKSILDNDAISCSEFEKESQEFYPAIWNGDKDSEIYNIAEKMPYPKNNKDLLLGFSVSELKESNPDISITFPIQKRPGYMLLQFVVEKDGTLSNFRIVRNSIKDVKMNSEGLSKILVNSIFKCCFPDGFNENFQPSWKPATDKGKAVRCRYFVNIKIVN